MRNRRQRHFFEGSSFVTEAKIQFGLLNTGSEGQHLAGALLERDVRNRQRRQADAQIEIEALQKQITKKKKKKLKQDGKQRKKEELPEGSRYLDEDYQVLLRIVQAEAGVCDEKGKILVADVIINRVLSGKFSWKRKGCCYTRVPSSSRCPTARINSVKVTAETIRCVDRALDGEDYSNGALYFMNRKASGRKAGWFDSRLTYLFAHGGHEFFK